MIFVLSLTCGVRAQIPCMESKIRAFLSAGMRGGLEMGRNSATGSPRRSITITPPSEASRTNSEVWMWSSRIEVFLMCYIVAQADSTFFIGFGPILGHANRPLVLYDSLHHRRNRPIQPSTYGGVGGRGREAPPTRFCGLSFVCIRGRMSSWAVLTLFGHMTRGRRSLGRVDANREAV